MLLGEGKIWETLGLQVTHEVSVISENSCLGTKDPAFESMLISFK